jgi:hypothetical protein
MQQLRRRRSARDPRSRRPLGEGDEDETTLCGACGCSVCRSHACVEGARAAGRVAATAASPGHRACLPAVADTRYPLPLP